MEANEKNMKHECGWPGCTNVVSISLWGCSFHWYKLPSLIRARIWAAYRPGQGVTRAPSKEYLEAAKGAQDWIKGSGSD